MSVIDKYPFINAVLTSLSDEDLVSLQECVNGAGGSSVFKSILAGSPHLLKNTDKGVYPIELEVAPSGTAQTVYPGFLIYNDDYCVLISFATERSQILTVLDLRLVNGLWSYEIKPFELSITDLRSELFDVAGGGGGASPSDVVSIVNNALNNDSINIAGRFAAPEYDPEETYAAGSVVAYNNRIYAAKEDSITGEWDSTKWDEKKLTELVGGGEGESVNFDIYFSDITQIPNTQMFYVSNETKKAQIEEIINKAGNGKGLYTGTVSFPYYEDSSNSYDRRCYGAKSKSLNQNTMEYDEYGDDFILFGDETFYCGFAKIAGPNATSYIVPIISGSNWDATQMQALFTAMAADANAHISFRVNVGGGAGSGSGGGDSPVAGGVESNVVDVCFSSHVTGTKADLHLYMFKNDYEEWLENNNVTESELLSTFNNLSGLEQIGFLQTHIGGFFQEIKSIRQAVKLSDNNSLKQAIRCSYIIDDLENPSVWSFSIQYISGTSAQNYEVVYDSDDLIDGRINEFDHPCTLSISTLDLVNVTGGQGGGTVEAEPIVSIKMTNLDARPTDAYEGADIIYTLEFCCTKERWDNFVSLASSQFQVDITYANFDAVFKQLNANLQGFALGYLLMDYYENSKKILPNLLAYQTVSYRKVFTPSSFIGTVKNAETQNIEVVAGMELKSLDGDGSLPNIADRTTVPYTTANTVITVEEIDGPAIGSSSGSGTSTTEFHAENGLIQMKGVYTAGGLDYTISSYISGKDLLTFVLAMKQASPLFRDLPVTQDTTTAELVEILQNAMDSVDQNVLAGLGYYFLEAGFGISIDQAGFGVNGEGVSSLYFDDSGTFPNGDAYAYYSYKGGQKQLLFYANDVTNATFKLNELTSGEITISGGSGSSVDLSNLQVGHLTFSNDHSIGLKSIGSIWSVLTLSFQTQYESYTFYAKYMCSEEEMYDLFNDKLEQYRQQGLAIPIVTDHDTLTQAFNIIVDTLFALNSEDAAVTIAGFIVLMFGPSVYGPFQGFMKDSGTTLFSLIRSGDDFGMYIISTQGNMVSVLDTLVNDIGTTKPTNISMWIND